MNEFQVGQLAQALQTGYMAHAAMRVLVAHPATTESVMPRIRAENRGPAAVPIAYVPRKDGTTWSYDLGAHLGLAAGNPDYAETYARVWLGGALITLGDTIKAAGLKPAPDLELVRHLRNGIAHGNKFNLTNNEPRRPAHFTGPDQRLHTDSDAPTPPGDHTFFEITPGLHGSTVLFDFMGPGDVLDLLMFIAWRLIRIGNGDPPADLWPQRP